MTKQFYWGYHKETLIVNQAAIEARVVAEQALIPKTALKEKPLPEKEGFQVCAVLDENKCAVGSEYVEDHRNKTVYNKQAPTQSKVVTQLGAIEEGWTLKKPATQFDNWDSQLDDWVTDLQAKYEYDYQQVNSIRGSLYSQIVDRLNSEAEMIRRTEGNEAKALDYEAQADAAYIKIREDNPWPMPPEA